MPSGLKLRDRAHLAVLKREIELGIGAFSRTAPSGCYEEVSYALVGGHRTRGVACLLACESVGGAWRLAVPLSVAIELYHKASVVRDDIADGDEFRRGRETSHKKYGIPMALAVSDFLLSSALKQVESLSPADGKYLSLFVNTFRAMATGQLTDVAGGVLETPETKEWGSNHRLKTGSLAALPFQIGGIFGGGSADQVSALTEFGNSMGLAFQLINDVRSLLGHEKGRAGLSADLRSGKVTPLVSWARHVADPRLRMEIDGLLKQTWPLKDNQVARLRRILIDLGAHDYSRKQVELLLAQARRQTFILNHGAAKRILYAGSECSTFVRLAFLG